MMFYVQWIKSNRAWYTTAVVIRALLLESDDESDLKEADVSDSDSNQVLYALDISDTKTVEEALRPPDPVNDVSSNTDKTQITSAAVYRTLFAKTHCKYNIIEIIINLQ
jgi:hypothetical protein